MAQSQAAQLQKQRFDTAIDLLNERSTNIRQAIQSSTVVDTTAIMKKLLADRGYQYNTNELTVKIKELQRTVREASVKFEDDDLLESLTTRQDALSSDIDAESEALRLKYRSEISKIESELHAALREKKASAVTRLAELEQAITARKSAIVDTNYPGLSDGLKKKEQELIQLKETEEGLRSEVDAQADWVRQARASLQALVQDKILILKAKIAQATAMQTEFDLEKELNALPSVSQMLQAVSDPDSMHAVMLELAPAKSTFMEQKQLARPV